MEGVGGVWGIVLAAGGGSRFGGAKQFAEIDGVTLLERVVRTVLTACEGLVCGVPDPADPAVPAGLLGDERVGLVAGGATRAESVRSALAAVPSSAGIVVIADAAHPLASVALVAALVAAVRQGADGAVPGLPLTEVVAPVADGVLAPPSVPIDRSRHVLVQTPQAFRAGLLRRAHELGTAGVSQVEDSAMVAALQVDGRPARVVVIPGDPRNLHVTTPAELDAARRLV